MPIFSGVIRHIYIIEFIEESILNKKKVGIPMKDVYLTAEISQKCTIDNAKSLPLVRGYKGRYLKPPEHPF